MKRRERFRSSLRDAIESQRRILSCPDTKGINLMEAVFGSGLERAYDKEVYVPHEEKDAGHGMKTFNLNFDDLDSVSKLQSTQRFIGIMQKVEEALQKGSDTLNQGIVLEDSPENRLIDDCNALAIDIENEIVIVHYFLCVKYRVKFPELESLVIHPIYYARVVKEIGNEMDLTLVDLDGLLPPAIVRTVSVTASTTSRKPLLEENLKKTIAACDRLLSLDLAKKNILEYFESRMEFVAPNLCAVVGNAVAAKLIWTAGGVSRLAHRPFGFFLYRPKSVNQAGIAMPPTDSSLCPGLLDQTEFVECTSGQLKMHVRDVLAYKSLHAARIDSCREDPTGEIGRTFRKEIYELIAKWQKLPLEKQETKRLLTIDCTRKRRGIGVGTNEVVGRMMPAEEYSSYKGSREYVCRARKAFEADETMSALSIIFQSPPAHRLDLMHPHVYYHWYLRNYYNFMD